MKREALGYAVDRKNSAQKFSAVVEKFVSINGEARAAGKMAAFIRFAGCNLDCSYCDTRWANDADVETEEATVAQLVSWVVKTGAERVTLTGGEPTLQPLLAQLMVALLAQGGPYGSGLYVEIETNGAVDLAALSSVREGVSADAEERLSFTMDCKAPSSGMAHRMQNSNYALLKPQDTVKFVVGSASDLKAMLKVIEAHNLSERCAVYVSPIFGEIDPAKIVDFVVAHKLARVTVQLQLHKIIWPNQEKGV